VRLDDLQSESCCDPGIKGIAASLENSHADCRRDPMGARDHPERAFDLGPRGEPLRIDKAHIDDLVSCLQLDFAQFRSADRSNDSIATRLSICRSPKVARSQSRLSQHVFDRLENVGRRGLLPEMI
jgi:hypothetical protein